VYKVIVLWICYELPFSIWSISIFYGTQSDIRVKSYCRLNLVRASVFNLECLHILRDSIGYPCIKLLSFEFATSLDFQFRASRYITGLKRTSEYKVIVIWKCSELLISILSVSIYYRTQSDIRVKIIVVWILLRSSVLNLESLNILRDSIGHPRKRLLSFEFATNFCFQFGAPRYITGLNRTSLYKVIVVWICYELPLWIWSISIYYGTQ